MTFRERTFYNCENKLVANRVTAARRDEIRQWFVDHTLPVNSVVMLPDTVGVVEQTPVPGYHLVRTREKPHSLTGVIATELFKVPEHLKTWIDTENTDYMSWMTEEAMGATLGFMLDAQGNVCPDKFFAWCDCNGIQQGEVAKCWHGFVPAGRVNEWRLGEWQATCPTWQEKMLCLCYRLYRLHQRKAWHVTEADGDDRESDREFRARLDAWQAEETVMRQKGKY